MSWIDTVKEYPSAVAISAIAVIALFIGGYASCRKSSLQGSQLSVDGSVKNPQFAEFESKDHEGVSYYEFDIIDSFGVVLQTIQISKATTTISGNIVRAPIKLYPLQPGIYTSVVRAVVESGGTSTDTPSANGTRVPPAESIMDNEKDVWTLVDGQVLENGKSTGGSGVTILWCNQAIYVSEMDGDWWLYMSGGWHASGTIDPCMGVIPVANNNTFGRSGNSNVSNAWERAPIAVY